jgi:hypothetical protein
MAEQKDRHLTLCMDFVEQLQEDNFLDRVITGYETWCYQYDPKAKCQSMTTVNQTFYVEVLKRPIDAMMCKRGEFWRDRSLILHHDNMPAHSLFRVSQFLAGKGFSSMNHLLNSPDLAPADF